MAGKVINLRDIVSPDQYGVTIANQWVQWNTFKATKTKSWQEVREYIFATDTTQTSNRMLPWKHTTTIPKLCQIRDNLHANYMASLLPKRNKNIIWDADNQNDGQKEKRDAIENYMRWVTAQDRFRNEMSKIVLDYIDYGNAFGTVEWVDERQVLENGTSPKVGYCGPAIRRISPQDIVFNPTAPSFIEAPKIIRSLVSMGEVKGMLESMTTDENREAYEVLYDYLITLRQNVRNVGVSDLHVQDAYFQMDGFTSYRSYLESDYVEILTFYGDIFDIEKKEFLRNQKIMVVDRHKVLSHEANPSYFGYPPIFHVGWRVRQDNLWAMGPLDNLVGMQYKIDHIENLKADVFDLITFPPLKIKGYVEDFTYGPLERIYCGEEGDVELMPPPFQVLQANIEIANLVATMEEMAGSPKEAMGFRTPGEKTAFEVQRLENAASRIFNAKTVQFEEQMVERLMNAALELSRRNLSAVQTISVFDDEFKIQTFATLTPQDITGAGRLKPVAARHFAETAELVQNLNAFYQSGPGQDEMIRNHISSIGMAKLFEELLSLQDWKIVLPNVRVSEAADTQRMMQAAQEQVAMEGQTPTGLTPDDYDPEVGSIPVPTEGAAV